MTDPRRYPDPLHVPGDEPTRARLQKAYEAGVADGHRIHVLALVLMIGLGFVIGFALASGVRAAGAQSIGTGGERVDTPASDTLARHDPPVPSLDFSGAVGPGSGAGGVPPPAPVQGDDGGGISSALVAGTASWYDVGPGMYGAVPSYRWGDPRYKVRVCRLDKPSRCVTVTVLDFCGCPGSRVIDLSRQAFARLESPSRGLVAVTVESGGGPAATLPATDVP